MHNKRVFTGLTDAQVEESRALHGVNILTPPKKESVFKRFLSKFNDPLILILLVAGVMSIFISLYEYYWLEEGPTVFFEPAGIFAAIILATGLGFWLELKAEREFAILNKVSDDDAVQVIRNGGNVLEIPRSEVVVGDIVLLSTGGEVPADGELLEAVSMSVDESTLTGEPICAKNTDPEHFDHEATFPTNRVLRGTKVMEGHGVMAVDAVGDATENGKVFTAAQIDNSVKTPLNQQLDRLGKFISIFSYCVGLLLIAGRLSMYFILDGTFEWMEFGAYLLQSIMLAVTLVVCSVPEGLPMAVTMSLAYSMRRMLKSNNLVRKLHACETMGAATVVCTDKTGTLTQNRMSVYETTFYGGEESTRLAALGMAVNSTAQLDLADAEHPKALGNPTEGALLLWLHKNGYDYHVMRESVETIAEVPFSTERKYMATEVRTSDRRRLLFVKGAPEIVLSLCKNVPEGAAEGEVSGLLLNYQQQGMRTLGFAWQETDGAAIADGQLADTNLTFLGIAAIADPVREDVPEAVAEVLRAGVDIKIVTGDTPATACEIGRQIGLKIDKTATGEVITGPEFAEIPDDELPERVQAIKIVARARPLDKKRLVEALQAKGEVVAVTGDGTNDAPALKAAQVGLSMGDGTSVAKEASDITIIDNSFSSIGRAIMWGRSLYRNIQRFILFQITVNIVACLTVLVGSTMGLQSPLTVTQMLWVNLIMDTFAAMALASLPPTPSVMLDKPRTSKDFIINGPMWRFIIVCGIAFWGLLCGLLYYMQHTTLTSLAEAGRLPWLQTAHELSPYEASIFFTVFVFLQFWNLFNARAFATGRSAFHFKGCNSFLFIAATIFVGQIFIVSAGGRFFSVVPLKLCDWVIIIAGTSIVLWVGELYRLFTKKHKSN